MKHRITIHGKGKSKECKKDYQVEDGANLLRFMQSKSMEVPSPCGGNHKCGKCKVRLIGVELPPDEAEDSSLSKRQLDDGYRLACSVHVHSDIELFLDESSRNDRDTWSADGAVHGAQIKTAGIKRDVRLAPLVHKKHTKLRLPELSDQTADVQRLVDACGKKTRIEELSLLQDLPGILRGADYDVTSVIADRTIKGVELGNTCKTLYGAAFDVGTTTIAGYLFDLSGGEQVDVASMLNPQIRYGADVITRIDFTSRSGNGASEMRMAVISAVNGIIKSFSKKNQIKKEDLYEIVFVGNTTMLHFLMGLPAGSIAVAPFIPATTGLHIFNAKALGLSINKAGTAVCAPGVAGYIGADTIAATLVCNMYRDKNINLMIDIGTNGEIVLGCAGWMYSCSTAAGPAFEGSNIRHGIGGISGAIDSVRIKTGIDAGVEYTTIDNADALGICGSGLVDLISELLDVGVIDETGRILNREDIEEDVPAELRDRITTTDGMNSFILVEGASARPDSDIVLTLPVSRDSDIVLTQKDVREVQNAKAAIAAGIKTLITKSGIGYDEVSNVYLAGGFGNYIDKNSAVRIGLIPKELGGKIIAAGNAAGAGAVECLLSTESISEMLKIRDKIKYIELSASPEFVNEYVESMMFE
ncbi:MAG: ASKHA domain-containing protein [Oscillospiraceae bacterium]|nr:ASKHA domain-containing protein [Oscillospiraceae bacterium]